MVAISDTNTLNPNKMLLEQLKGLIKPNTLIGKETLFLWKKLILLEAYLDKLNAPPSPETETETKKLRKNIGECAGLMIVILNPNTPEDRKAAHKALKKLIDSEAFEIKTDSSLWKQVKNAGINYLIKPIRNAFGSALIPGMDGNFISRGRVNNINLFEQNLQKFLTVANHDATTKNVDDIQTRIAIALNAAVQASNDVLDVVDNVEQSELILVENENNNILSDELAKTSELVEKIAKLSSEVNMIQHNKVLYPAAQQALLTNQTLILELLQEIEESSTRMTGASQYQKNQILKEKKKFCDKIDKMSGCIDQTIRVINNPGDESEITALEKSILESDYLRYRRNKEKSSYTAGHIGLSSVLLGFTLVAESLVDPAVLAIAIAELISIKTGFAELHYHRNSETVDTLYYDSMHNLIRSARIDTSGIEWENDTDKKSVIDTKWLQKTSVMNQVTENNIKELIQARKKLQADIKKLESTNARNLLSIHEMIVSLDYKSLDLAKSLNEYSNDSPGKFQSLLAEIYVTQAIVDKRLGEISSKKIHEQINLDHSDYWQAYGWQELENWQATNTRLTDLKTEIDSLRENINTEMQSIEKSKSSIIIEQAKAVLDSSEDLLIDLLNAEKPDLNRVNKLRECIKAANDVFTDPANSTKVSKLVNLLSKKDFEAKKLYQDERKFGIMLIFASAALLLCVIPGIIASHGHAMGTLLSPFMVFTMGIKHIKNSNRHMQTSFSQAANTLAEYAQLETLAQSKNEEQMEKTPKHPSSAYKVNYHKGKDTSLLNEDKPVKPKNLPISTGGS